MRHARAYITGMASPSSMLPPLAADADGASPGGRVYWLAFAVAGALLALAGALLWLRFGAEIFFDMLAAMQGCF